MANFMGHLTFISLRHRTLTCLKGPYGSASTRLKALMHATLLLQYQSYEIKKSGNWCNSVEMTTFLIPFREVFVLNFVGNTDFQDRNPGLSSVCPGK
jgi:hypothetical protein